MGTKGRLKYNCKGSEHVRHKRNRKSCKVEEKEEGSGKEKGKKIGRIGEPRGSKGREEGSRKVGERKKGVGIGVCYNTGAKNTNFSVFILAQFF